MAIKLSIVIPVYNSHEIVRRQRLHFTKHMPMRDDYELIIVDDNSNPPIEVAALRTTNKLAWTQGLARNEGAAHARGEYLFMTDIDHIISKEALEDALNFNGNKMIFRRKIAVLDENGEIRQDRDTLMRWGYDYDAPAGRHGPLDASVHGNTWVMRKDIFEKLGGYSVSKSTQGFHPISRGGEDSDFNARWNRAYSDKEELTLGRDIYLFPLGRFNKTCELNPFGLFHSLHQREEVAYK